MVTTVTRVARPSSPAVASSTLATPSPAPAGGNLYAASREWAKRPADQRFDSLESLHTACLGFKASAAESTELAINSLRVKRIGDDLSLVGPSGGAARFSNWSFGQLCRLMSAPSAYLATLPAQLAEAALNHGLTNVDGERTAKLLLHKVGSEASSVRAINGAIYDRIWNADITKRLFSLRDNCGWKVPPARPAFEGQPGTRVATEADCIRQDGFGLAVKPGDLIAPAGLYASDRDLFAFLVNPDRELTAGGSHLFRGVFITNSEVGDKSFRITKFLFNNVCGNHIVWGASEVIRLSIPHIGDANGKAWAGVAAEIERYSHASAVEEQNKIGAAARFIIGKNKEDVLDKLFGLKVASRKVLEAGAELAEEFVETDAPGCSPWSAWGFAQGLTRHSQTLQYADARTEVDAAAGKVIQVAF